jgi:hypothetical protein
MASHHQRADLFVSNYPLRRSVESVMRAIQSEVERRCGAPPVFLERQQIADGTRVTVPNATQADAVLALNGALILNHPIWIVRSVLSLGAHTEALSVVFAANSDSGIVDLERFAEKFAAAGSDPSVVDLNDRDFVEFFLFRLGTESRDSRFWVKTLVLTGNGIRRIDRWAPFLCFLPNLREIKARDNPMEVEPGLPVIDVDWDGRP